MATVTTSENCRVCVRSVPVRFYFLGHRSYLFIKTIDPDEVLEIHYCLVGGALGSRLFSSRGLTSSCS